MTGNLEFEVSWSEPHIVLKSCSLAYPILDSGLTGNLEFESTNRSMTYIPTPYINRSNSLWPAILNLKSVNLNLMLFWHPVQLAYHKNYIAGGMTRDLEFESINRPMTYLYPCFLREPKRSNKLWPAILNLKSVYLNPILFWNPAHWRTLIWILDWPAILNLNKQIDQWPMIS